MAEHKMAISLVAVASRLSSDGIIVTERDSWTVGVLVGSKLLVLEVLKLRDFDTELIAFLLFRLITNKPDRGS